MRRVVITGIGAVTPLGIGVRATWQHLLAGRTATVNLPDHRGPAFAALPSQVGGLVPSASSTKPTPTWQTSQWSAQDHSLSSADVARLPLFTQYALAASLEALHDSFSNQLPSQPNLLSEIGVSVGSGIGSLEDAYATSLSYSTSGYRRGTPPLFVPRLLINMAAGHISMRFGLQGPNIAPTTACTTGAHSISTAFLHVAAGDTPLMLAGASESCIHPLAIAGFARARSLSTAFNDEPGHASRPFDAQRDGFVIGEGSAVLILEELEHARHRGAPIYAELLGCGLSADAWHVTQPRSNGAGAALAMRRALKNARREPREVGWVNAHATGTVLGDVAELRAVGNVLLGLGQGASGLETLHGNAKQINISSTKGAVGHLLGAAGALEAVFSVLALRDGVIPPTANLDRLMDVEVAATRKRGRDKHLGLEQEVAGKGQSAGTEARHAGEDPVEVTEEEARALREANFVPKHAQEKKDLEVVLSNSFGFGGTNASLCFGKFKG